jgi:SAM-dependent methyltransferase
MESTDEVEYTNLDRVGLPGVDLVFDLEWLARGEVDLGFHGDYFDHVEGSHLLEHLDAYLPVMEELWRVTKPGGTARFTVPYGASDEAWEDPTHRRSFTHGSWRYLAQPTYWFAAPPYAGDWDVEKVTLRIPVERAGEVSQDVLFRRVVHERNVVTEMVVDLRCVKPAREPSPTPPEHRLEILLELLS